MDMASAGRLKGIALPDSTQDMVSGGIPGDICSRDNILGMVQAHSQMDMMLHCNKLDMGC